MCGRQQVLLHVLLAGSAADGILAVQCMSVVVVFGIMVDGTLRWYVQLFMALLPSLCVLLVAASGMQMLLLWGGWAGS